jgi:hypothetical protein
VACPLILGPNIPLTCKVHAGFASAFRRVAHPIYDTVDRLFATGRYRRLVVAGHSLGGALATLAAVGIVNRCFPTEAQRASVAVEVITFGSPRVGNRMFQHYYDATLGLRNGTWRHVHHLDLIPTVPPAWFGYSHVGTLVAVEQGGPLRLAEAQGGPPPPPPSPFRASLSLSPKPRAGGTGKAPGHSMDDHYLTGYMASLASCVCVELAPPDHIAALRTAWKLLVEDLTGEKSGVWYTVTVTIWQSRAWLQPTS